MLQANDEAGSTRGIISGVTKTFVSAAPKVANTVGKLQYRLLLCQWEKGNVQRQLQTVSRQNSDRSVCKRGFPSRLQVAGIVLSFDGWRKSCTT